MICLIKIKMRDGKVVICYGLFKSTSAAAAEAAKWFEFANICVKAV
ncbi:hypothetical protein SAMN05216325_14011 [Nitrosomonas marina]|uniref:Uncharacterized protein n=1 Tax=Nitrosomonas marina TaxID=917 RepID=A0A1H8ISY8_9PROT|nr:hypothetical protein SAMN05216325_14011 [Nitrosomonas marina]